MVVAAPDDALAACDEQRGTGEERSDEREEEKVAHGSVLLPNAGGRSGS